MATQVKEVLNEAVYDASQIQVLEGLEGILTGIEGLAFVRLGSKDVVRHRIVQDIVDAYDKHSRNRGDAGLGQ